MNIKRRDMKLTGFHEGEKRYFSKYITDGSLDGIASIIKFYDVKEPTTVKYNFKEATIVDSGYTWIQIAFIDQRFWLKAMYDEKNNLIEVYIDVTVKNIFDDLNNPEYDDLFLDIVVPSKGHVYEMDQIELMSAKTDDLITDSEYKEAKVIGKKLISKLEQEKQGLLNHLWKLKLELEYELENNLERK